MGAILTATSIPGRLVPNVGFHFADKLAHALMYGALGFLMTRALDDPERAVRARALLGAFMFCLAMGAADEWHQKYIQGRSAEVGDWIADSTGGLVGAATWVFLSRHKHGRTV